MSNPPPRDPRLVVRATARLLTVLGLVALAGAALAQLDPPASPDPVTISTSDGKRVRGLGYDASTGQQDAQFVFSIKSSGATSVVWSVDGAEIVSARNGGTCPYTPVGVGKHSVGVKVGYSKGMPVSTGGLTFAAIGGPLSPNIAPGEQGTPDTDLHAGGGGSAKYIQYFGYDPSLGTPDGAQTPQMGVLAPALGQLTGTAFSWSVIGNAAVVGSDAGSQITLGATDQSGYGSVGAHCTFTYIDPQDGTLKGSCQDDSDGTPPPGTSSADPSYYRFTSHKPNDIADNGKDNVYVHTGTPDFGIFDQYFMRVIDHLGLFAGGVWVQERYPNGETSGTNAQYGTYWITNSAGGFGPDSIVVSSDAPYLYFPPDSNDTPLVGRVQKYYAGTKSTELDATGVYLGTYHIYGWTDHTEHSHIDDNQADTLLWLRFVCWSHHPCTPAIPQIVGERSTLASR